MRNLAAGVAATAFGASVGLLVIDFAFGMVRTTYGGWLFLAVPVLMGAATGYVYNMGRHDPRPYLSLWILTTMVTAGIVMIGVGFEGAICLVMATPVTLPLAMLGGVIGREVAVSSSGPLPPALMLALVPFTAVVEPEPGHALHEVQSSVVINAPPDEVWPHVVAFSELPPPTELIFRAGIAYPIRARIEGEGVGAVRYCVFSTGSFVEPITRWEPGRRLSFDVADAPASMNELSPYEDLSPPHLHGYFRSKRGEFRFVDLGDGRTRLEGSTWYQIEMAPEAYWRLLSDALIHRIHGRVLEHIKREVEADAVSKE